MATVTNGSTLLGVDAVGVRVEVDLLRRLPAVVIVGLPSAAVRESAERIRSAILATDHEFPRQRVVVSLAPADLRKEGTSFDLAIAVGILAAARQVPPDALDTTVLVGELSLGGSLRPVRGALAHACAAREGGFRQVIVPRENQAEAALVDGIDVRAATTLTEVVGHLQGHTELPIATGSPPFVVDPTLDLRDVRGQATARLALEVAAAGGHNVFLSGPPGCGKTMLASRLPGILPTFTRDEALVCTRVHSAAGLRSVADGVLTERPFRAPHHTISVAGMFGNAALRPGEVSLAHGGVLFLDEFPEFPRHVREALRAPLEDRQVVLARAGGHVVFPASFMLVAAANPCPCGFWGHATRPCVCGPPVRERYRARLSGPLADRIDLHVDLEAVKPTTLLEGVPGEPSAQVRSRVERARARQLRRQGRHNAELGTDNLIDAVHAGRPAVDTLRAWMERSAVSARVGGRVLKVARTLADLDDVEAVDVDHIERAVRLRSDAEDDAQVQP